MKRGKVYLLKGGHVLRCHGPWGSTEADGFRSTRERPNLAFSAPSRALDDIATGYSAAPDEVIKELDASDLEWLPMRLLELEARGLDDEAEEIRLVIRELRGTAPATK